MNHIKSFSEYSNINENIANYQYNIKAILSEIGVKLYYVPKYETAILSMMPLIETLFTKLNIEYPTKDIALVSIFIISVLSKENKEKAQLILNLLKAKEINDDVINNGIKVFKNINFIFNELLKLMNKPIGRFPNMFDNTALFITFTKILNDMINNETIDSNIFLSDNIRNSMDGMKYHLLLGKIMKKMYISSSSNKFQNIDNVKPLLAHDEFKPKMYQTDRIIYKKDD